MQHITINSLKTEIFSLVFFLTQDGDTPLLKAVRHRNEGCVMMLLEKGAKVSAVDKVRIISFGNFVFRDIPISGNAWKRITKWLLNAVLFHSKVSLINIYFVYANIIFLLSWQFFVCTILRMNHCLNMNLCVIHFNNFIKNKFHLIIMKELLHR